MDAVQDVFLHVASRVDYGPLFPVYTSRRKTRPRMSDDPSISQWIEGLRAGEAVAAQRLWERYAERLVGLARRRMGEGPKGLGDEEDVAQSVFHALCRGAAAGRFASVKDRDDLWWLLLAITKQKVIDHHRRETAQKRGGGRVTPESGLAAEHEGRPGFALDRLVSDEPTAEMLLMLEEQNQRLLGLLRDDNLRSIAMSRVEGYSVEEIAGDLQVSMRSIERKLNLIRQTWTKDLIDGQRSAS